ncbi:DNA cytosine methyltransferase [Leisingera sp. ANG-M6]|uniref:DNA cytosine methyltransferase n=1 Tax=Leisingera sp. ANG-M6 TaxID=1577900 RepID=UPI001269D559|nr:DNA cytosine methyltransferase [Leisingera sp. ANG-M6]
MTDGLDLRPRNGLSLFAGGGGLDMGLMLAEPGFHTRCFVEWEEYPQSILIAAQEAGYFAPAPIWDDVTSFDGRPLRRAVDTILAGYPCQGESYAGKRMLDNDPRWMWPQVERLAKEVQPRWLFLENVRGHVTGGAETVLRRLHDMGFKTSTGLFTAAETGAPHERCRWFTVAYSRENCRELANASSARGPAGCPEQDSWSQRQSDQPEYSRGPLAGAFQPGWEGHTWNVLSPCESGWVNTGTLGSVAEGGAGLFPPAPSDMPGWSSVLAMAPDLAPTVAFGDFVLRAAELAKMAEAGRVAEAEAERSLCRMVDGLAQRTRALKLLGNGVFPLAAAHAWRTLSAAHGLRPVDLAAASESAGGAGTGEFFDGLLQGGPEQ